MWLRWAGAGPPRLQGTPWLREAAGEPGLRMEGRRGREREGLGSWERFRPKPGLLKRTGKGDGLWKEACARVGPDRRPPPPATPRPEGAEAPWAAVLVWQRLGAGGCPAETKCGQGFLRVKNVAGDTAQVADGGRVSGHRAMALPRWLPPATRRSPSPASQCTAPLAS